MIAEDYLTTAELARLSGLTESGVRESIRRGRLPAVEVACRYGKRWMAARADADAWLARLPASRRPRYDRRQIAELARQGATAEEIAAKVGCNRRTVFRVLAMPVTRL